MTTAQLTPSMSVEQGAALAEFARACKSAARAVSLYPGAHPAIGASLTRLVAAANRLTGQAETLIVVHPDALAIDERTPARPDPSIAELAELFHGRLVGTIRIFPGADTEDWRQLLLLLASPVEDLLAHGGIANALAATGRNRFEIKEIDYAEVLRERRGADGAEWDRVLAFCLKGEAVEVDDAVIQSLLEAVSSSEQFAALLDRLNDKAATDGLGAPARVAALMQLLRTALSAVKEHHGDQADGAVEQMLESVARATPHMVPDMLLGLLAHRDSERGDDAALAKAIVGRIDDGAIASFVARSVVSEGGASERLTQVFEALVPEGERKVSLLGLAKEEARSSEFGTSARFEEVWQGAVTMLAYSDKGFVSADYARELTAARVQAIEVERVSDDPPERIAAWLATITDPAVQELDQSLLLDLLRIEGDVALWKSVATLTASGIERRALVGDIAGARRLADALASVEAGDRPALREPAGHAISALARGPLARHVVSHLRKASDVEVAELTGLCQSVGPRMVLAFAEALSTEDHTHTIRRIRELLIGFGSEGRLAVEPLKNSTNPAVRRTAIDLLRVFGGNEALGELTVLLADKDPQVQRDALRAIVQIGTPQAVEVIDRACASGDETRELLIRELIALRDGKTVPSLAGLLTQTSPRGRLVELHEATIEALAGLGAHEVSTRALRATLDRGEWWAPVRTGRLRRAAAVALRRIGSPESLAALQDAAENGSRGVRNIAKTVLDAMPAGKQVES